MNQETMQRYHNCLFALRSSRLKRGLVPQTHHTHTHKHCVCAAAPTAFDWKLTGTLDSVFGFAPFVVLQVCLVEINSGSKIFILGFSVIACGDFGKASTGAEIRGLEDACFCRTQPEGASEAGLTSGGSKSIRPPPQFHPGPLIKPAHVGSNCVYRDTILHAVCGPLSF